VPKAIPPLKPLTFVGSSRDDLREMPETVRHAMGVELMIVQLGGKPTDFKPNKSDLDLARRRYKLIPGAKP
jgi:phage-related protein